MAISRLHNLSRAVQRSFSTRPPPQQKIGVNAVPKPSLHAAAPKPPSSPFDALGLDLTKDALGPESEKRAVIEAFGASSFTISGVRVLGSVLIMPKFSTLWNVNSMADITSDAFALVQLIVPRPDVVIVGTGAELVPLSPELRMWFRDIRVNVESMDTKNACHTFNVLNEESRNVSAALLPPAYRLSDQ